MITRSIFYSLVPFDVDDLSEMSKEELIEMAISTQAALLQVASLDRAETREDFETRSMEQLKNFITNCTHIVHEKKFYS